MNIVTRGLVIRETDYRDSDRIVTLLTAVRGRVSASCRGARSGGSRLKAGTQHLVCADFTLFERDGRYTVDAAEPAELFTGLRSDIEALALASYFCELLETVAPEDSPCEALLSDALNALYALSKKLKPHAQIKAAFELRLAAMSGWMPDLSGCAVCGGDYPDHCWLSLSDGDIICDECAAEVSAQVYTAGYAELDAPALSAARYALSAESRRMLSFSLNGGSLAVFQRASERYLLRQLDREFGTLEFYKTILMMDDTE